MVNLDYRGASAPGPVPTENIFSKDAASDDFSSPSKICRKQILKQVRDWFLSWHPWQQKTLLCGITNRCSTQQLEALATTLEPVFHRDFVTVIRHKYPSTGFKDLPKLPSLPSETPRQLSSSFSSRPRTKSRVTEETQSRMMQSLVNTAMLPDPISQHHNAWTAHRAPGPAARSLPGSRLTSGVSRSLDSSASLTRDHVHKGNSATSSRRVRSLLGKDNSGGRDAGFRHSFRSQKQRASLRPVKRASSLAHEYRYQLSQIWQWLSEWEDHEGLGLLADIVKLSSPPIQVYLAQCLYQRLQERIDINWLPDQVLLKIFSKLSVEDIKSTEQVCQRWRHLCSMDELWQYKCQEFGRLHGIRNLLNLVQGSIPEEETVDWRLAYTQLTHMTEQAKRDIPVPQELSIKSSVSPSKGFSGPLRDLSSLQTDPFKPSSLGGRIRGNQMGLAAQLAMESSRLKKATSPQKSVKALTLDLSEHFPVTPSDDAIFVAVEGKESRQEASQDGQSEFSNTIPSDFDQDSIASHAGSASASKAPTAGPSVAAHTSVSSGALLMRGRKRKEENREESALDIRMNLTQAQDLLGNLKPNVMLHWRSGSDEGGSMTSMGPFFDKYCSEVKPICRVRKLLGHMDAVLCIDVDFRRLISGSMDRSIRIWDIRSGRSIHKLYGHKGAVSCLKFSDNTLYSGSWDTTIMVWDLVTFARKEVLSGHSGSMSCLHLNEDNLLSGSHDGTVRVWGRKALDCLRVIEGHQSHVLCLSCDRMHAFSGSTDKTVRQTIIKTGICVRVFSMFDHPVHRLLVRNQLLIIANENGHVFFTNIESGVHEAAIKAHDSAINALAFHQGHFFTAANDKVIKEWDLGSMTCMRSLAGHKMSVLDMKISARRIISCSSDGHIRIWETFVLNPQLDQAGDDTLQHQIINQEDLQST